MIATVPVTLVRRTARSRDALGKEVYTTTTSVVQGIYAPGTSTETVVGQDQVTVSPKVYLPDVPLDAIDQVQVLGLTFEVDGIPLDWPANPFSGWRPDFPLEVPLKQVAG